MASCLCASEAALKVHRDATAFAEFVGEEVRHRVKSFKGRFAASALANLQTEAQVLHGAVLSLCDGGWAASATILLRTSMELLLSAIVIALGEDESEYLGFIYTRSFEKAASQDASTGPKARERAASQIAQAIERLPAHLRQEAREWASARGPVRYWYEPKFKGPDAICTKYERDDLRTQYRTLSGPVHGGLLGLRLYRDDPDRMSATPRSDPKSQSKVLVVSSYFLAETSFLRGLFHGLSIEGIRQQLRTEQRAVLLAQQPGGQPEDG